MINDSLLLGHEKLKNVNTKLTRTYLSNKFGNLGSGSNSSNFYGLYCDTNLPVGEYNNCTVNLNFLANTDISKSIGWCASSINVTQPCKVSYNNALQNFYITSTPQYQTPSYVGISDYNNNLLSCFRLCMILTTYAFACDISYSWGSGNIQTYAGWPSSGSKVNINSVTRCSITIKFPFGTYTFES